MRKLWPPTYDDVGIRIWAAIVSVVVNSLLWAFAFSGSEAALRLLMVPGIFLEVTIAGRGFEEGLTGAGVLAWALTELVFYYFIAWWLIRAFQPVTNWWPEKRS